MNSYEQDNSSERREFGETIEQLDRLADALDRQRYPGEAWPVRRLRTRKVKLLWRVAAGATAAAAVILLALLIHPTPRKDRTPIEKGRPANDQLVENGWEDDYAEFAWGDIDSDPDEYELADSSDAATDVLFDIYDPSLPANGANTQERGVPNTTWPEAPNGNGNGDHDS